MMSEQKTTKRRRKPTKAELDDARGMAYLAWSRDWSLRQALRGRPLCEVLRTWNEVNHDTR